MGLCAPCQRDLPIISLACQRCGVPTPVADACCGDCQKRPPAFDGCRIPYAYAFPIDELVKRAKFGGDILSARLLGLLLAEQLRAEPMPECLMPVPLHPRRLLARGYNQAAEIARAVSLKTGVPMELLAARRVRHTAPQTQLTGRDRRRNVRAAFEATRPFPYREVAVVDDVVTTGHTVNEFAKALKQVGVEVVRVWACTRAAAEPR